MEYPSLTNIICHQLANRRNDLKLSLYDVSKQCGLSPQTIQKIEKRGNSTLGSFIAIAEVLGMRELNIDGSIRWNDLVVEQD
jgi:transcriptional regulator with XRE-family HTH domain